MPPRPPAERPSRVCARCGRPFTWRRKWARDWEQVRYCSDRCRMGRGAVDAPAAAEEPTEPVRVPTGRRARRDRDGS